MGEQARTEVRVTRRLPAPPERVFDAWLDASTVPDGSPSPSPSPDIPTRPAA